MGTKTSKQVDRWGDGGVTVTFVHRETGARQTVYEPGKSRLEAVRQACFRFDPREWRADVISTPQSIYDDITHSRKLIYPADRDRGGETKGSQITIQFSAGGVITGETQLLRRAGCIGWK